MLLLWQKRPYGWHPSTIRLWAIFKLNSISAALDWDKGEIEKTNKSFAILKDNAASVNELNFTSTKAVVNDSPICRCVHNQKLRKPKWTACVSVVPKRPMKDSSENEETEIALKFCPVKPAQEHLKCNSQERQNEPEPNSNHQSVKVPSENRISLLNSVANSCKRKAAAEQK